MILRNYNLDTSVVEIPLEIFSAGLSCKALGVLTYIYSLRKTPSIETLAERLEESQTEILKALEELEQRHFLKIHPEGLYPDKPDYYLS
ncbi:helix-turn-helix domain-containing protein [Helicobacter suis]|uniref:MarR family transcriptional regulator n=1 Tax=Helicobacter suis TaxID=104628 RepID=A0A6J4CYL5_9HELI|nr:helix-turn-helix domain-containing protein [Helicobacter suis]BCD69783.1 hypothetical protein SNTW_04280 [Helicobacter suis]